MIERSFTSGTALRAVERAIGDLRRGWPVLLDGVSPWVMLPAETATATGLIELAGVTGADRRIVLTSLRAVALTGMADPGQPAAYRLVDDITAPILRHLADPTLTTPTQTLVPTEPPPPASAALLLLKQARLLPAALLAPAGPDARALATRSGMGVIAAGDLNAYAAGVAQTLERLTEAVVPLDGIGPTRVVGFRAPHAGLDHLAILVGQPETSTTPLVRVHSECFTGDLLGSLRCDCGPQLHAALRRMASEGAGILLYLAQEGRGIGLMNKLRAYALQDRRPAPGDARPGGLDTLEANHALGWAADERDYVIAAAMLRQLGVARIRLMTNNPDKLAALREAGLVVAHEPHRMTANGVNDGYLATKAARFGHLLGE